ncbi:MAG TPA: TonB-dependent receptor [Candidatus Baltobacteraceae bacterium]|jgi:outer membrane receptor protein involved in Fe transport
MLARVAQFVVAVIFAQLIVSTPGVAQVAPTTSASITGTVTSSSGAPVAGALVTLSGPRKLSTQTDSHGAFAFNGLPIGLYKISAKSAELGTTTPQNLSLQSDVVVSVRYEAAQKGLRVIATTSTTVGAQINSTPASITQISPITNAMEGDTSWRQTLEQIPGVAQAGLGSGSFGGQSGFADSPLMPIQVSIDGALPYESAILLDDMPLIGLQSATSQGGNGTDLGFYPLTAFGSADVIRGPGASASIVDSIGGTLSLHALSSATRNHFDLSISTDPYGGTVIRSMGAIRANKLTAVVTYGLNDSPGPLSGSGPLGYAVFTPTSVNGRSFNCTGTCAVNFLPEPYSDFGGLNFTTGLVQCCVQQSTAWSQISGSAAIAYAISPNVSAQVFYAGQTSRMDDGFYSFAGTFEPPAGYTGSFPSGNHTFPGIGLYLSPAPYENAASLLEEKITATIGSGVLRVAALQNRTFSSYSFQSASSLTQKLYGGGQICTDTSPSCATGTYEPITFNGGQYQLGYTGSTFGEQNLGVANNRDRLVSYTTPLGENMVLGASFVQSYYNEPDQFGENYAGTQIFSLYPPMVAPSVSEVTDESRLSLGINPSRTTTLELADYFVTTHYHVPNPNTPPVAYLDEVYTYSAPRLGFVWRPSTPYAFRFSAGGGFAEAPLSDLLGTNAPPTCQVGDCFTTLTNLALKPEESFSFDAGADARLNGNDLFTFDMYRSNLYGQIYQTSQYEPPCATCGGQPLYVTQFGNLGSSRFEGIALGFKHDVPHGLFGNFSGGFTRSYVLSLPGDFYNSGGTCNFKTQANCQNLQVVPGINMTGAFGTAVPYAQAYGRVGYRWKPGTEIDFVPTYFGNNNTYFRPAFVELDAHARYALSKNLSLMMTFKNITGMYDSGVQVLSAANASGAPVVAGLPSELNGEEYGPRTVLLTMQLHL